MTNSNGNFPDGRVLLLGICSDDNSSFLKGAAQAPDAIRAALHSGSANWTSELGVNLDTHPQFADAGNIMPGADSDGFAAVEERLGAILRNRHRPLILGGDHAVTLPALRVVSEAYGPVDILHLDAHPDLYDELDGNRLSHACPFARIMEQGLAGRVIQAGIRTLNAHQREQAQRFGVEIHQMRGFEARRFRPQFDRPLYLSVDMDVLDPAFAPGVSHHEPGGLSVRQVLTIVQALEAPMIGADIVEYNPLRDIHQMTAMVGAKLVKEIAGKMLTCVNG